MIDKNESQQKIDAFVKNLVDKTLNGESFTDKEQETLFEDLYQECKEHFESEQVFFLYINEQLKEYASTKI